MTVDSSPPTDPFARDVELVERCLAGDSGAWVELVDRYKRLIYSVPVKLGLPPDQADEVFQDVCARLLSRLDTLRDGRSLARWLVVTAKRRSWDLQNFERRFVAAEEQPLATSNDPSAEETMLEVERAHLVRQAFEQASGPCRELLHDLFYRDPPLSYAEIAARTGRPQGSLGPTRIRCLKRLHDHLLALGFH